MVKKHLQKNFFQKCLFLEFSTLSRFLFRKPRYFKKTSPSSASILETRDRIFWSMFEKKAKENTNLKKKWPKMTTSLKENFLYGWKITFLTQKSLKYRKKSKFKKGKIRPNTRSYGKLWPFLYVFDPILGPGGVNFGGKIKSLKALETRDSDDSNDA